MTPRINNAVFFLFAHCGMPTITCIILNASSIKTTTANVKIEYQRIEENDDTQNLYPLGAVKVIITSLSESYATLKQNIYEEMYFPSITLVDVWNESGMNPVPQYKSYLTNMVSEFDSCLSKLSSALRERVQESLECIQQAIEKYGTSTLCISFNGGKDSTVLLHLIAYVYRKHHADSTLNSLYITSPNEVTFSQIEVFIQQTLYRYPFLSMYRYYGEMKLGLTQYKEKQGSQGVFVGNRRTDPYSEHLKPFQETDPGWPRMMRIHPILEWSYKQVWEFLRGMRVPYCELYDQGYTSLGNRENTKPNPSLVTGTVRPAYELEDEKEERKGRNK